MKTVLVTGCSSGYGLETARHFHAQGWNVVAAMRTPRADVLPRSERLQVVALDVTKLPGDGPFHCEVRRTTGEAEQAAVWGRTPSGNAKVIGASSNQAGDVGSIVVTDRDGHVLGTAKVK